MACPSCNEAKPVSADPAAVERNTRGWARSIYTMMAAPYLLFGGATIAIVRSARRSKKAANS